MSPPAVLISGVVATAAMAAVFGIGRVVGATRLSLPRLLGTGLTPDPETARRVGAALLVGYGLALAPLFAMMLSGSRYTSIEGGAVLGLAFGLLVLIVAPVVLPAVHPRMASPARGMLSSRGLVPPGWLALHYGVGTAPVTLLAHGAYGAVLGALLAPWVAR
jgi:hypothetical protein